VEALVDPERTSIVLVSRPERSALGEAERTRRELADLGIANQRLLLNGVFRATDPCDVLADPPVGPERLREVVRGTAAAHP
jgi:arsenite-transporting ATPase